MPRETIALPIADLSAFSKTLRQQLQEASVTPLPSHLSLMNMVARAAGHRNIQALRVAHPPRPAVAPQPHPARGPRDPALSEAADRALRQFDAEGRLARWPAKRQTQQLALWGLWMAFDAKRDYREAEVNEILNRAHGFGDHCTLRRELVTMKLLWRTPDGGVYRKLPARPEPEVAALLTRLRERQRP